MNYGVFLGIVYFLHIRDDCNEDSMLTWGWLKEDFYNLHVIFLKISQFAFGCSMS